MKEKIFVENFPFFFQMKKCQNENHMITHLVKWLLQIIASHWHGRVARVPNATVPLSY